MRTGNLAATGPVETRRRLGHQHSAPDGAFFAPEGVTLVRAVVSELMFLHASLGDGIVERVGPPRPPEHLDHDRLHSPLTLPRWREAAPLAGGVRRRGRQPDDVPRLAASRQT